ncbi:hypothetical protein B0H14DRAFT_2940288 [Mycena olivaceomarginata]|nr:hypothetical protein B0H14DRAFT_2940288 [Mycena olivaceomarginata]
MASDSEGAQDAKAPRATDVVCRDHDYYHPTGDSIIRIENTLFKVTEGDSDDLPIALEGERAEEFRAVLKYIYAPPLQTQVHSMTIAALPELVSVAKFADKYGMDHWRQWALSVLATLLANLDTPPVEHFPRLYSLYHRLHELPMRDRVMKSWCAVVEKNELSIIPVLEAAEATGDEDALAEVYCVQIRRWQDRASMFDPETFTEPGVSPIHIQRILFGYSSLSLAWSQLHHQRPPYPFQAAECQGANVFRVLSHHDSCIPYCRERWTEAISDAERQYPHITQVASRLSQVGWHMKHNTGHLGHMTGEEECFADFVTRYNHHVALDSHCLANHFFPRDKVATKK